MKLKKWLPLIILAVLKGLVTISVLGGLGLIVCGLSKNSREWIEKNRVADIYKVYPTKNPEDLFKVFPDGFGIRQSYTGKNGVTYELNVEGDPDTKKISGDLVKDPIGENKKVSDVSVEGKHYVFSDSNARTYWPIDSFLFQHWSLNQEYVNNLKNTYHGFNTQNGSFSLEYKLSDSDINNFLSLKDEEIKKFEISGSGEDYYERILYFKFTNKIEFFETIDKYSK
ncbi:hypothetical protein [Streptococcus macacae]|uniref:Lipoprotein n=1 Tax=Streptococcus macacae NCTC 11558 TaxID=764298 RepID=G5JWW0_9STRE|nr:hypothetical protein [Streptococcus macacae]EHJ52067.1 hypothetical protein STRMA_1257 [Streptococcus macacae NCTC 11558]SUN79136.1 lipoprotein [Streptococcus macacae NCTC 11558]